MLVSQVATAATLLPRSVGLIVSALPPLYRSITPRTVCGHRAVLREWLRYCVSSEKG
ncbi:MAG: hypothetical protein Q8K74_11185 [Candidatus Nitrotoga sp.]|nr:hypothetical protein [Candidatus Nitrotoga sp.]MDP1856581.1 hypothetical protein [Candidatus Nitrotoga sp.]